MRKVFSFLAGFLVGSWIGLLAAFLFAPQAGAEIQRRIRDGVERLVEEGRLTAEARRAELEDQLESFKHGRPIVLQSAEPTEQA